MPAGLWALAGYFGLITVLAVVVIVLAVVFVVVRNWLGRGTKEDDEY